MCNRTKSESKEIFLAACQRTSPDEQASYLNVACHGDDSLRLRVGAMLTAEESDQPSPLDLVTAELHPANPVLDTPRLDIADHPLIGPYRLIDRLGEGGMGEIFVAEQTSPVHRTVALKLIKSGMDSRHVIARFEVERQALAMMDHANIAKVLDVGTTDSNRPFFVMELVEGVPITKYCDNEQLSPRERLKLFVPVCQAVQHAHQKGIIHRDIKPSNVMVAMYDGRPMPKVIDFGIAKAIDQQLTEETVFTQMGEVVGTPEYMSPEQTEPNQLDTDTRSDIYSLGVLLYELLTGTTPFSKDTLRKAGFDELRRIIREDEPPRPSVRITTFKPKRLASVSNQRQTDPRKLSHSYRGELDWIVMKALEKDRTRRYETANGLAADIKRYLVDEPVVACPPSTAYRLKKFATRHKTSLMTSALVAISLIIGSITSFWQTRQADQARRLAEEKSFQLEEQRDLARENESYARQLVYASDVRLAAQAWEGEDVRHYADLLDRYAQVTSSEDLRGFEWRYLRQLGTADFHLIAQGTEGVCSVRYSPDGKLLATGRQDATIDVLDARSGRQLATLSGHDGLVRGIDFSPDSKRLASIGYGGVIRIWDMESFREIRSIKSFTDAHGYRVRFALAGQAVIAVAESSPAKLWDVNSGELISAFGANGRGAWGLAVSPNGQSCVVCENKYDFRVWNLSPPEHVAWIRFPLHKESACCLRYSPDGAFIAAGTDEELVRLYEARTGKMIASFAGHDDQIWDVAFHPNSTMLASCDSGGVIRTWNLEREAGTFDTNKIEYWPPSFRGPAARVWSIDFSPDGTQLVSASRDGTVLAWTEREHPRHELKLTDAVTSKFTPFGDELFIASAHAIARWNRMTKEIQPFGESFQEDGESLAISPDGEIIATGHHDGSIRLWNRKTEQIDRLLHGHEESVNQIAFSPTGTLMVSASLDGTGKLWDIGTGEQRHVFKLPSSCLGAAFSPDGQTFAILSEDNATLYDVTSGTRLHLLQGHQYSARCVAFSPDGRWLATGSGDRTVRIWDVQSGKVRHIIAAHRAEIYSLAFSPDGRTIASGDEHGTIAFSHVETGRFLFDTQAANKQISGLSFSPDGEILAATCFRKQVVLLHAPGLPSLCASSAHR